MADAHQTPDHDSPHEGPIKTPKQLVWAVVFAFLVPIIGIILLANFVAAGDKPAAGSDGMSAEAVARRIAPVAGAPEVKDASDLTTHGVIVGMTGSGKTGLGVVLLEEALSGKDGDEQLLYSLGSAYEKLGKVASAWSEFKELAE